MRDNGFLVRGGAAEAGDDGVAFDDELDHERRGVLPVPERTASGYRTYTPATVERIRQARRLQQLGLTLDEVIDALHATDGGDIACASEHWRLEAVLDRVDSKIAELQATRRHVQDVITACDNGRCASAEPSPQQAP